MYVYSPLEAFYGHALIKKYDIYHFLNTRTYNEKWLLFWVLHCLMWWKCTLSHWMQFYIKLNIYVPSTACLFVVRCFSDPRTINRRVWTKKWIHFQYNLIHYMYIHINCVSKRNTCNFTCSWLLRKKNVKEIYLIYQCICIYIILPVC